MSNRRPIIFGEVLFDRFPDGSAVLGGAPFNVAWNLHAFGMQPLLISRVGNDPLGEQIRATMQAHGMDLSGLQADPTHPTGSVEVSLHAGEPSYTITPDCAYDFIDPAQFPKIDNVGLLYHGSLALRRAENLFALQQLSLQLATPLFVDVNLRAPWYQAAAVSELLQQATWGKLNEHEQAELDLHWPRWADNDAAHPNLETLFVTHGEAGAIAYQADGSEHFVVPQRSSEVVDTVGAGDAFCSVLIMGLLKEWPLQTILDRAQQFASAVVTLHGAVSEERDFYTEFQHTWSL